MCLRVYVLSLDIVCFDSLKFPTVLCLMWELPCHEYDPLNADHMCACVPVIM